MLHITNGDSAANLIKDALGTQEIIAWQDILYEGPVPNLGLHELSQQRAEYLADRGYGELESILQSFQQRDKKLATFTKFDEVVLWFEHDTYDQLQLVQILAWFAEQATFDVKISLICINEFPGITPFLGFGQLNAKQIASLLPKRESITDKHLQLATTIWSAFTSDDPIQLAGLLEEDLTALPFMEKALIRYLREFPSTQNGLSWTEDYILKSISSGLAVATDLFKELPRAEKKYFIGMGDTTFYKIVDTLASPEKALITITSNTSDESTKVKLTPLGESVLKGEKDWIAIHGIDCWRGGAHLQPHHFWRWDDAEIQLHRDFAINKVNVAEKLLLITEYWTPKIAGEINDSYLKLAKFKGNFVWHKHDNEDELFFVVKGCLLIKLRDKDITLNPGEFVIIPKGVEHLPTADEEVHVILLEPKTTLNTGDVISDLTKTTLDRV